MEMEELETRIAAQIMGIVWECQGYLEIDDREGLKKLLDECGAYYLPKLKIGLKNTDKLKKRKKSVTTDNSHYVE